MSKPRVLLADDHVILLESLKLLLASHCEIVATATDGQSLIDKAKAFLPAVILTDIYMPQLNGLESLVRLRQEVPTAKVIFLTVNEDQDMAREAIRRGAYGYILKKDAARDLVHAIQWAVSGRMSISQNISTEPTNIFVAHARTARAPKEPLSIRQREVLQLLAEGKSMKEVAAVLKIAARTVAFHKYQMMQQLGISRNSELVLYAARSGSCTVSSRAQR